MISRQIPAPSGDRSIERPNLLTTDFIGRHRPRELTEPAGTDSVSVGWIRPWLLRHVLQLFGLRWLATGSGQVGQKNLPATGVGLGGCSRKP
jgi:hypothetical protein